MSKKILTVPINGLSFGNVTFGIINELFKRKYNDFIIQDLCQPDLTSFDKVRGDEEFVGWLNEKRSNFLSLYKRDQPSVKLWHIQNSHNSTSFKNSLFTFHELDEITPVEKNILNNHDNIIVSSQYTKDVFVDGGVTTDIKVTNLGFDSTHFYRTDERTKLADSVCHWYICGKFEHRKRHEKTVKAWINKYGGNPQHMLNLCVYNPHFNAEQNQMVLHILFEGKQKPFNVNVHGFYPTLTQVNSLINMSDIVIDMSGAEAWSIPSFNSIALGKHGIIHNNTAMKEWATEENAVLVEPSEKISVIDNVFFKEGTDYNIGNIFDFDVNEFSDKLDVVYKKWKTNPLNEEGLKLQEKFTWSKTVDTILSVLD